MVVKSLGMIEVKGYLGAVVAADAALKSADIKLRDIELATGGLVNVMFVGEVAAVETGVNAGISVIQNLDCLVSHEVIARLDVQTGGIIPCLENKKDVKNKFPKHPTKVESKDLENPATKDEIKHSFNEGSIDPKKNDGLSLDSESKHTEKAQNMQNKVSWRKNRKELEKMRVSELRKQARQMGIHSTSESSLNSLTKNRLIKVILDHFEGRDD